MIRRIALALPLLSVAVLSAQGPGADNATLLPVTRVVLYKTGIGYFEHLGTVTGNQSLAVQFTGDQLDDVLKSLTAVDLGAGRVTGIGYDSPTPAERRLQALRVPLAQDASTLQVLEALRGSRIEVRTAGSTVAGRLLDVERRTREAGERIVERDEVTLVTDAGEIVTLDMAVLEGSASERRLLERYTQQLDAQETRLDVLRRESAELSGRQTRVREELETLMMAVTIDVAF